MLQNGTIPKYIVIQHSTTKVQAQDAHVPLLGFSGDREMAQWGKHLLCMQEN